MEPAAIDELPKPAAAGLIVLRLYIASGTLASAQASANLAAIGEALRGGEVEVEVVDILREPLRSLADGVLVTPTLVRLFPLPEVRIVGDLSVRAAVLAALS